MTASQIVAKSRNLPQPSPVALKLIGLLDHSQDSFDEASELIRSDSYLTLKLLRACNSAAFGLSEQVASVDQALMLVGFDEVRRIVVALGLGRTMTSELPAFSMESNALWRHAFVTATVAEEIAVTIEKNADPAMAFTAGLLHDIGKVFMEPVLALEHVNEMKRLIAEKSIRSVQAEREVVGSDHAEVGACLLHIWMLPDPLIEGVANHHQPVLNPAPRLSAVCALANKIAHLADGAGEIFSPDDDELALVFELNTTNLQKLTEAAAKGAKRARELQETV